MEVKLEFNSKWILKWTLLALAFTPLIALRSAMFPFITGKVAFIRLAIAILFLLIAIDFFKKRSGQGGEPVFAWTRLWPRSRIFLSVLAFTGLALVSTILARIPYLAFFGNIERGEGFLILLYMLLFLLGTLLVFKKKDWLNFFKLSSLVGIVVSIDMLSAFLRGIPRPPGSFIGNPTFIAAFMLFVIFSAWILVIGERRKLWLGVAYLGGLLAFVSILISGTRGAFLGVLIGLITVALLALIKKEEGWNLKLGRKRMVAVRKVAAVALIVVVLFAGLFIATRNHPIWGGIPVLDRLAQISSNDQTTQSRLFSIGTSVAAVTPGNVGILGTLFGWGPDNFEEAYNEFYNPAIQKFELEWFDRAHNKILDVLVMNGLLGLLAYLAIWFFILKAIFKKHSRGVGDVGDRVTDIRIAAAVGFFATAFFVQNLFVFDQITTYVPLYAFLGFVIYQYDKKSLAHHIEENKSKILQKITPYLLATTATLLVFAFVWLSLVPIYQMSRLTNAARQKASIVDAMDSITKPNNYAQAEIRYRILSSAAASVAQPEAVEFILNAINLEKEVIDKGSARARAYQNVALIYTNLGKIHGVEEFLTEGGTHISKARALAPGRQEIMFFEAQNLILQGRINEAVVVAEELYNLEPEGRRALIFWLSTVTPYDIDDSLNSLDRLYDFLTEYVESGGANTDLGADVIGFVREGYKNHLAYFIRAQDSQGFVAAMSQAIKIEEVIDRVGREQLEKGLIEAEVETHADALRAGLRAFQEKGWAVIRISAQ
ncbi:MAG: O-antigen ligase family protein [Candidatus Colwellbacteria bacterium]